VEDNDRSIPDIPAENRIGISSVEPVTYPATAKQEEEMTRLKRVEQREKVVFQTQADAPNCSECGSIMVRNGNCYKCIECGTTSGCS